MIKLMGWSKMNIKVCTSISNILYKCDIVTGNRIANSVCQQGMIFFRHIQICLVIVLM